MNKTVVSGNQIIRTSMMCSSVEIESESKVFSIFFVRPLRWCCSMVVPRLFPISCSIIQNNHPNLDYGTFSIQIYIGHLQPKCIQDSTHNSNTSSMRTSKMKIKVDVVHVWFIICLFFVNCKTF